MAQKGYFANCDDGDAAYDTKIGFYGDSHIK